MIGDYVVTRECGLFGTVVREYIAGSGEPMVVIRWGPLGWITPVRARDCKRLSSRCWISARREAEEWISNGCR